MNGRILCVALLIASALLMALPGAASAKLFFDVPGLPGESTNVGFENQIELGSFQFGLGTTSGTASSGPKLAGKAAFSSIVVTKQQDKASPQLMLRTANGTVSPTARVTFTRTIDGAQKAFLRYCFTQVRFTGWSTSSGGDNPSESVVFSYATIVQSYTQQAADGTEVGTFATGWDLIANLQFNGACNNP